MSVFTKMIKIILEVKPKTFKDYRYNYKKKYKNI